MLRTLATAFALAATPALAVDLATPFASIDGGELSLSDWSGQPVLVVNTASMCGYTGQYSGLQELYDSYRERGLVVLAVPSNDFNQELGTNEAVKEFCEINYGIDMPMTEITTITGPDAHSFYASLRDQTGFAPRWNFNKVLIGPDGNVAGTFGSNVRPDSPKIVEKIETMLD